MNPTPASASASDRGPGAAPSVLHLGWAVQSVSALRRIGAAVTCVLAPADAPAARALGARAIVVPDPTSVEDAVAALARESLAITDFAVVCSGLEYCLVQAAVLAELGGVRGIGLGPTIAMRDKFVQKDIVRRAGIRTAQCRVAETTDAVEPESLRYPQVLKPLDGAGAKHTLVLREPADLRPAALAASGVDGAQGPWLLEEFVPGKEFFVDGVVRGGVITLFSLSRYLHNVIDVRDGRLVGYVTVREEEEPELYPKAAAVAQSALRALEHRDGVFHLEVFWDGAEAVFGECAARVGGGKADKLNELAFGVDLHEEWALAVLGLPSRIAGAPVRTPGNHGGVNLRSPRGTVTAVPTAEHLLAHEGVVHAEVRLKPGQQAPDFTMASNVRAGQLLVSAADGRAVEARLVQVSDWFFDTVRVAEPAAGPTAG